jgi:ribonuclease HI
MSALLIGAIIAVALIDESQDARAAFFTDSAISLGHLTDGWSFAEDAALGKMTRMIFRSIILTKKASVDWVRAHDAIFGNEKADELAKIGALASSAWEAGKINIQFPNNFPKRLELKILANLKLHKFDPHAPPLM